MKNLLHFLCVWLCLCGSSAFARDLTWSGGASDAWDKTNTSWTTGSSSVAFADGDAVTFGDIAGQATATIPVSVAVGPLSIALNATTTAYNFTGTALVTAGSVTVGADATASFATPLTVSGTTAVNGTLTTTGATTFTGVATIAANGTLTTTGTTTFTAAPVVNGTLSVGAATTLPAPTGTGKFVQTAGTRSLAVTTAVIHNYDVRGGTLTLNGNIGEGENANNAPSFTVATGATLVWNGKDMVGWTKPNTTQIATVAGTLKLSDAGTNETFSGKITLQAGGVLNNLKNNDKFMLHNSSIIEVESGATASITGNRIYVRHESGAPQLIANENAILNVSAPLKLGVDLTKSGAGTANFSGVISEAHKLNITGGTVVLSAANTYSGGTDVTGATLKTNALPAGTLALKAGSALEPNSAALTLANAVTMADAVTLNATHDIVLNGAVTATNATITVKGTRNVTFANLTADATSTLAVAETATVTVGEVRPKVASIATGAKIALTATVDEIKASKIEFSTSLTEATGIAGSQFTVKRPTGTNDIIVETVAVAEGKLSLSWVVKDPKLTLTSDGNWSSTSDGRWANLTEATAPIAGNVIVNFGAGTTPLTLTIDTASVNLDTLTLMGSADATHKVVLSHPMNVKTLELLGNVELQTPTSSDFTVANGENATTIGLGGFTLTKSGAGALNLTRTKVIEGTLEVATGSIACTSVTLGAANSEVTLKMSGEGTFTSTNALTLGGETFFESEKSGGSTIACAITNPQRLAKRGSQDLTLSGSISGDGKLDVVAGKLILTAANSRPNGSSVNGTTTIATGATLDLSTPGAKLCTAWNESPMTVNGTLIVHTFGYNGSLGTLSTSKVTVFTVNSGTVEIRSSGDNGNRPMTIGASGGTFFIPTGVTTTISESIVNNGGFTKAGDGALTLSGVMSANGPLMVSAGRLKIATAVVAARCEATADTTIAAGATLELPAYTGERGLYGDWRNAANSPTVTVRGTLIVQDLTWGKSLGGLGNEGEYFQLDGGTVEIQNNSPETQRPIKVLPNGGTITVAAGKTYTQLAQRVIANGPVTFSGAGNVVFHADCTIAGSGALTLAGTGTYSFNKTCSNAITVGAGATITGTANLSGAVTFNDGAKIDASTNELRLTNIAAPTIKGTVTVTPKASANTNDYIVTCGGTPDAATAQKLLVAGWGVKPVPSTTKGYALGVAASSIPVPTTGGTYTDEAKQALAVIAAANGATSVTSVTAKTATGREGGVSLTAEQASDALGCFSNIATVTSHTIAITYDFGISALAPTTNGNGLDVTAKVQGVSGTPATFAQGVEVELLAGGVPLSTPAKAIAAGTESELVIALTAAQKESVLNKVLTVKATKQP